MVIPEDLKELLDAIEAAATIATVPSAPLIYLSQKYDHLGEALEKKYCPPDVDEILGDAVADILEAAETLTSAWSFFPATEFGSNSALLDPEAAQEAIETVLRVKKYIEEYADESL